MFGWLQDHYRHFRLLGDQHAHFHPVVEFFTVQSRRNDGPRRDFRDRPELLIFVEWQTMDMDLWQLQHIFLVICFMRGLIASYRECDGWPERETQQTATHEASEILRSSMWQCYLRVNHIESLSV